MSRFLETWPLKAMPSMNIASRMTKASIRT